MHWCTRNRSLLPDHRSLVRLAAFVALACLAASRALAQEAHPLGDLGFVAAWQIDPWSKAAGQVRLVADFPPGVPVAPDGQRESLAVEAQWPGGDEFRFLGVEARPKPLPIPFRVEQVRAWMKGSGTNHAVELHFHDAAGKDVKVGLGSLRATEWKEVVAPIPGDWAQPLTFRSVVIHNWDHRQAAQTTLLLARLEAIVTRAQTVSQAPDTPRLTVVPGDPGLADETGTARVRVGVSDWGAGERTFEIRHALTDWNGAAQRLQKVPVRLTGEWWRTLSVRIPQYGAYAYTVELWDPGKGAAVATVRRRLARLAPVPKLSAAERAASCIGVNTHHAAPWQFLGRCGIHWARDYSWGWLGRGETAPVGNGMDFSAVWRQADQSGITVLPCLMQVFRNPDNTAFIGDASAVRTAMARIARALPEVPFWELDNEADLWFPGARLNLANYRNLVQAAAAGLRDAGKAQVVLNGTAGIDYDETVALLATPARNDFAVVNYHYYTGTEPPETATEDINAGADGAVETLSFADQLRRINRLAHEAGKEGWLTEVGWDVTNGPAVGERLQAVYLPRAYLMARACGTDKIFWFYDRDVPGSTIRFSTCGLLDLEGDPRPSAAAMAALSRFAALAEVGGSVDLGPDRWCVLLRQRDGTWVAAAWSVTKTHPLPKELAGAPAYDLFGNQFRPERITPEVAYFALKALPAAWESQRQVEWLSLSTLTACPGGAARAILRAPHPSVKASWEGSVPKIALGSWVREGDNLVAPVRCAPDTQAGTYVVAVRAQGDGWQRKWPVTLSIVDPVRVASDAFPPAELLLVKLRPAVDEPIQVRVEVPDEQGAVLPQTLSLRPGRDSLLAFAPSNDAARPVPVTLRTQAGAVQTAWFRPRLLTVPRVTSIRVDGRLDEWPAQARLDPHLFVSTRAHTQIDVWLGWSEEGLWVAARASVKGLKSTNPREFWEGTSLELFVDTGGEDSHGWGATAHQFWFTPVREENGWRLYAGEWKRGDAIPATIYEDRRGQTSVRVDQTGFSLEAFVPNAALGGRPAAPDAVWRAALSVRAVGADGSIEAGWPYLKSQNLLSGSEAWGAIRFVLP